MNVDDLSQDQIIEIRKFLGNQIKDATSKSRHERCLLCDEPGGFCNSHTIPQFCLENIAWNGKLNSFNTLVDTDLLKKESGINNAGTFHIICRSCDSKVFQDYENADAYVSVPSYKALNQIALKNSLRDIYKHETEVELYELSKRMIDEKKPPFSFFIKTMIDAQIKARSRDIEECYEIFNKAKSYLSSADSWLKILCYDKLEYTVPIAFQGMIALVTGVNGEIINNNFNHKKDYKMEYLHIAVFPFKGATAIMMFLDSEYERYEQFEKFIADSTLEERLEIVNRIIFLYAEDYFLSKQLSKETIKSLEDTAKTLQDLMTLNPQKSAKDAVKDYDLRRDVGTPNLLLETFAIDMTDV